MAVSSALKKEAELGARNEARFDFNGNEHAAFPEF